MQTEAEQAGGRMMLMMDPPDHTRYRKLVNRGFTPADDRRDGDPHPRAHHRRSSTRRIAKDDVRLRRRRRRRAARSR